MRKLKLAIEELRVESFDTSWSEAAPAGTVRGHGTGYPDTCTQPENTCDDTRGWTCDCLLETENLNCNATHGSGCSLQSPHMSMCDFSCEFACPVTLQGADC